MHQASTLHGLQLHPFNGILENLCGRPPVTTLKYPDPIGQPEVFSFAADADDLRPIEVPISYRQKIRHLVFLRRAPVAGITRSMGDDTCDLALPATGCDQPSHPRSARKAGRIRAPFV